MRMYVRSEARGPLRLINVDSVGSFAVKWGGGNWDLIANTGSGIHEDVLRGIEDQNEAERLLLELVAQTGFGDASEEGAGLIEWDGTRFRLRRLDL